MAGRTSMPKRPTTCPAWLDRWVRLSPGRASTSSLMVHADGSQGADTKCKVFWSTATAVPRPQPTARATAVAGKQLVHRMR